MLAPLRSAATHPSVLGGWFLLNNISLVERLAAPSATVPYAYQCWPIPTLPIRRINANQNLLKVFEWNPHPSKSLAAKTASPNTTSIKEMWKIAANIRDDIKQTLWMANAKCLNASTNCTALA
ncbi:MAG: hypothetical protein ACTHLW_11345 [Verrucomicrobiota bacterium]